MADDSQLGNIEVVIASWFREILDKTSLKDRDRIAAFSMCLFAGTGDDWTSTDTQLERMLDQCYRVADGFVERMEQTE